jgi:hypothetical protein
MRQPLYKRLRQLEVASAQARKQSEWRDKEADMAKVRNKVGLFLRLRSVEQGSQESLMEAWSRALEISARELRQRLSAGIDPIHQYFADHGIYEAIQTIKAAGTWPGG